GGLVLLCWSPDVRAQSVQPVARIASIASGSIQGYVQDERGAPVIGATVSALGATFTFATTDRTGRFELRSLSPGPYFVRAHSSGFVASPGQYVHVRASSRASSTIALRHADASAAVFAAGLGSIPDLAPAPPAGDASSGGDDHGEVAWRLRHARRAVLKDATVPDAIIADAGGETNGVGPAMFLGRAAGSPARLATSFFTGTPFSGQVNLLTTGTFDSPQQLFTIESFSHGVAYMSVSAPAGPADWTVRGALTQGDISSWILAGSYTTR